ncbi:MAG: zinc ribbon domain-containing protein [Phycisphaerae bacterium]|nr:zinc ribbon domain-containing protein [Phycisphaerae bacterium]
MKNVITRIILLVVFLAGAVWVNSNLSAEFGKLEGVDATIGKSNFLAGANRFMAQVNWMRLLQFRATASEIKNPDDSVTQALYRRYDMITDQDPFMALAYEHGGLELATMGKPGEALKLLDKGMKVLNNNWKLPHYAAHISSFYLKDDALAEKYLKSAHKIKGHPFFIEMSLVRLQAAQIDNEPVAVAKLWKKICLPTHVDGTYAGSDLLEYGGEMDSGRFNTKAHRKVIELLREVRAQAAEATGDEKKILTQKARQIEKIIKTIMPKGHFCPHCFAEYKAGDKHCNNCGRGVEVFGVCQKCGAVADGKYCRQCGTQIIKKKTTKKKSAPAKPVKKGKKG